MIKDLGQIMLYVENQERAVDFWQKKVGFEKVNKIASPLGGFIYELAPTKESTTELVLQDKNLVAKFNPEMNFATPSILMSTDNIEETYNNLIKNGVQANPIMDMGNLKVFNFCDEEGNYFAIRQI